MKKSFIINGIVINFLISPKNRTYKMSVLENVGMIVTTGTINETEGIEKFCSRMVEQYKTK